MDYTVETDVKCPGCDKVWFMSPEEKNLDCPTCSALIIRTAGNGLTPKGGE